MGSGTPPLVGRDAELQTLDRALDEVDSGRARAVGVVGEPGIGKSRLLDELGRRARARGHAVVDGRASELERDIPFALWVQAVDDHLLRAGPDPLPRSVRRAWPTSRWRCPRSASSRASRRRRAASDTSSRVRCGRCWRRWRRPGR